MKILGISASPRGSRSQTLRLVKAVLKGAKSKGAEAEMVNLRVRILEEGRRKTSEVEIMGGVI